MFFSRTKHVTTPATVIRPSFLARHGAIIFGGSLGLIVYYIHPIMHFILTH